jgi:hypothetical protein
LGVDDSAIHGAAADAENAEGSQRRPEGAEKREEKRNTLSHLLSLLDLGVLRVCGGGWIFHYWMIGIDHQ